MRSLRYKPEYPFKPFIFLGEPLNPLFDTPKEVISNSYLKLADEKQIQAIKSLIGPIELLRASSMDLPNIYEVEITIEKEPTGTRTTFKALPPKYYRYWIIEHDDLLFKHNLALAVELTKKPLTVLGEIGQLGATRIVPIKARIFYASYRLIHNEQQDLNNNDIDEISEIYGLLESFNKTIYKDSIIGKVLKDYDRIKEISHDSTFKIVGYFSMIESLLTHNPRNSDTSIDRQLQKKIVLINNQLENKIDLRSPFNGPNTLTDQKIIEKLYDYRSKISHGDYADFNKELRVLGSHDKTCTLLDFLTKTLIKFSIKYPQLILDLKEC